MRFVHAVIGLVLWVVATPLLLVAVARALPFDNVAPLPQIVAVTPLAALVTLPLLVIALFSRRQVLALLLAVALAAFAYWTVPFFVPPETPSVADPADAGTLRVMTVNALRGQADAEQVVGLVESQNVEVLAVQELTPGLAAALAEAGLDDLLTYSFTVPAVDTPEGQRSLVVDAADGTGAGPWHELRHAVRPRRRGRDPGAGHRRASAPSAAR